MKRKSLASVTIVLLLLFGVSVWYTANFPLAPSIELPPIDRVKKIEVHSATDIIVIEEGALMKEIVVGLSSAKPTRTMSINEHPVEKTYDEVKFIGETDHPYTTYVYKENGKLKLEQPYHGVYIIDPNITEVLPVSFA